MKKNLFLMLLAVLTVSSLSAKDKKGSAQQASALQVSFNYQRQPGPGSNQYAVWIEDSEGKVVRTLFVTSYTTKGRTRAGEQPVRGYVKRPACVPTWVKTAKAAALSDQQLDAFTGATPQTSGQQTFTWDFTDQQDQPVPAGNYRLQVEATLFGPSTVLYTGNFSTTDKPGAITLSSSISQPAERNEGMISDVKATLVKEKK